MKIISLKDQLGANNRRCLSAGGFSLLPSALRSRLFCLFLYCLLGFLFSFIFAVSGVVLAIDPCSDPSIPCLNISVADNISLDLKPISSTGTFAKSDATTTTVSAVTNYFAGYTLGIAASNSNVDAANLTQSITKNEGTENEEITMYRIYSIGTISGVTSSGITEAEFSNDSNIQYNNTWGYKVTNLNNTTSTNYLPVPTNTTAITLDTTSEANTETANNYNIAIGARVDADIPKGTYTNTFVITAIANPIPYTITFDKGNAEAGTVSGLPSTLDGSTRDATVTLPNTIPTRTGRKFLGWCSAEPTETDNVDSCSGTTYNPNGDGTNLAYTINQTASNANITLYAMWRPLKVTWENNYSGTNLPANETTIINGPINTLPTPTKPSTQCNGVDCFASFKGWYTNAKGTGDPIAAGVAPTDDVTYYAIWNFNNNTLQATHNVATAEDGTNCAGTKYDARDGKAYNVALITGSDNKDYCFTLNNLKVEKGVTLKTGDSDIKAGGVTYIDPSKNKSVTATSFTMPDEGWTSSSQNYYCRAIMAIGTDANNEHYYNWYAAKANPYQCLNPTSNTNATSINDGYSLGSICPAGWSLPTYNELTENILWDSGNNLGNLATSGYFRSGSQVNVGSYGDWWSSARFDNYLAYRLDFLGSSTSRSYYTKYYGYSVRCMRSS